MCGFIAQLVEHRTGIAEITGSNPVVALNFFQASFFAVCLIAISLQESFLYFTSIHSLNPNYFIYFASKKTTFRIESKQETVNKKECDLGETLVISYPYIYSILTPLHTSTCSLTKRIRYRLRTYFVLGA